MKLVMNVRELAEALGLAPGTVSKMCSESPEKLPPMLKTMYRRRQWSVEVVEKWVRERTVLPGEFTNVDDLFDAMGVKVPDESTDKGEA